MRCFPLSWAGGLGEGEKTTVYGMDDPIALPPLFI